LGEGWVRFCPTLSGKVESWEKSQKCENIPWNVGMSYVVGIWDDERGELEDEEEQEGEI